MLKEMKWSEFLRIVKESGFVLKRHGKRHDLYEHRETKERLLIERHQGQEIRHSLARKLLKRLNHGK